MLVVAYPVAGFLLCWLSPKKTDSATFEVHMTNYSQFIAKKFLKWQFDGTTKQKHIIVQEMVEK